MNNLNYIYLALNMKMKPSVPKFKNLKEIENDIITQPTSSSGINSIKKDKRSFYQTRSTNFSSDQMKKINYKTPTNRSPNKLILKKNSSTKNGIIKPIINILTPKKENENKKLNINTEAQFLLPTNINSFLHLMKGNDFGIYEKFNWALGLRDYKDKKIKKLDNTSEPSFYAEDLEKYKKKQKRKFETLIEQLNPNYNKIKHLILRKGLNNNINFSQFKFSTCLRNYKKEENKFNKQREKSWKNLPLPSLNSNKYEVKCLSPITNQGIENYQKLEKITPKIYQISYGETIVGNDKIKTKNLINNRNYTICGFGGSLGDKKYNNKFGDNNMFANKNILRVASNPLSKFELGLRIYGSLKNIKNYNKTNIIK